MQTKKEIAANNHAHGHFCSSAVLCAFADEVSLSEAEARKIAAPFAGGKMTVCGAVLAAEYVLTHSGRADGDVLAREFAQRFLEKNGAVNCRTLKGRDTGVMLRSCRGCVEDAAEILDEILKENAPGTK